MKIGWIGTGVMGTSMAGHVQAGGNELFVFNRTKKKARPLLDKGAQWCDTPAQVAENTDMVFSIVGFPADVEGVYLGDEGILSETGASRLEKRVLQAWTHLSRVGISEQERLPWPSWWVGKRRPSTRSFPCFNSWERTLRIWERPVPDSIPRCAIRSS